MRTSTQAVMQELAKHYDDGIELTGMLDYNKGLLVMFNTYSDNHTTHRVAFFQHWSVETTNDTLVKKWDFIA